MANSWPKKFLYIRNRAREALIQHSPFLILTLTPQTLFLIDSGVETEYKPASYVPCGKLRCTRGSTPYSLIARRGSHSVVAISNIRIAGIARIAGGVYIIDLIIRSCYGPAGQARSKPGYLWYASSAHPCLILMFVRCTVSRIHQYSIAYEHFRFLPDHMAWSLMVCITCSTRCL